MPAYILLFPTLIRLPELRSPPAYYSSTPQVAALTEEGSVDCYQEVGSCRYCFTDYAVSIQAGEGKVDWNLELATYHWLGSCRSPNDPVWRCLNDFPSRRMRNLDHQDIVHDLDHQESGLGEVRRRWVQEGGEVAD